MEKAKKNSFSADPFPTAVLLAWYDRCRRHMPWREDPTPYHVWLSEIMLQQTRVEAVREYYDRFLSVLPDIQSLAEADEDTCLKLWQGLGYYNRIRNMQKAAKKVMADFDGALPSNPAILETLPGIGHYTAGAISSIAFQEKAAAVDGNLLRVYARFLNRHEPVNTKEAVSKAENYFLSFMPADRPGDFNQALMDLGATVCLPNGMPHCEACPLKARCLAYEKNTMEELPVLPPKAKRAIEKKTVFLIRYDDRILLRKRPEKGLLAGLYEFPNREGYLKKKDMQELFPHALIKKTEEVKHIFTHKEWHMIGFQITVSPDDRDFFTELFPDAFWATKEELETVYSVPSAFSAYQKRLLQEA